MATNEMTPSNQHATQQPLLPLETVWYLQNLFSFHILSVKQQLLTLAQKYAVTDEAGRQRFFVIRPPKIFLNALVRFAQFIVSMIILVFVVRLYMATQNFVLAFVILFASRLLARLMQTLLAPYRDIRVCTDESERFQVLLISQDNKFGLYSWYTIHDVLGAPVARARRNLVKSLWRRQWVAETLDGREICSVREDALSLALMRRYLGTMWGLLRTNFDVLFPNGAAAGEYNRKMTITDQYVLDLRQDPYLLIDRRVALALAILLDSAEGR